VPVDWMRIYVSDHSYSFHLPYEKATLSRSIINRQCGTFFGHRLLNSPQYH